MVASPDGHAPPTPIGADRAHLTIAVPPNASKNATDLADRAQRNLASFSAIVTQLSANNAHRRKSDPTVPYLPVYASHETAWTLHRACASEARFDASAVAGTGAIKTLANLPWALVATRADHSHIEQYLRNIAGSWLHGDWRPRFTCARPVSDDEALLAQLRANGVDEPTRATVAGTLEASRAFAQCAVRDEDRTIRSGRPYSPWYTEYRIALIRPGAPDATYATIPTLTPAAVELAAWAQFGTLTARHQANGTPLVGSGSLQRLIIAMLHSRSETIPGIQDDMLDQRAPAIQREIARTFFEVAGDDHSAITTAARVTKLEPASITQFLNDVRLHLFGRHLHIVGGAGR